MHVLPGGNDYRETPSGAVSRRLRAELANMGTSYNKLSKLPQLKRVKLSQAALSRRNTGLTSWTVDEVALICQLTGISYVYVMTGIRVGPSDPGPGDGLPLPRMDSNHQPPGRKFRSLQPALSHSVIKKNGKAA